MWLLERAKTSPITRNDIFWYKRKIQIWVWLTSFVQNLISAQWAAGINGFVYYKETDKQYELLFKEWPNIC